MKKTKQPDRTIVLIILSNRKCAFEVSPRSLSSKPSEVYPGGVEAKIEFNGMPKSYLNARQLRARLRQLTAGKQ